MKQARVPLNVIVPIEDEKKNPDGSVTAPVRIHTNYKSTLRDMIRERCVYKAEGIDALLESYVALSIYEKVGIPFTPLTSKAALELEGCVIEEVESGVRED